LFCSWIFEKLKQFILQTPLLPDGRVILSGKDYHYLVRVRRVEAGDVINALLPDGIQAKLAVVSVGKDTLLCDCTKTDENLRLDAPSIVLRQALPRPAKMDLLVRQATEGGVSVIVPFVGRHSVKEAGAPSRLERWRRIVREARQQSGSPVATTVADIHENAAAALDYYRKTRVQNTAALVLHEKKSGADGVLHRELASRPEQVFIVIGPEGGLSDDETATFIENGFIMVNMGENVLRVETAVAWAVGVVSVLLREASFWTLKE
jgi:16S rRNA (uracil1498-N3)-methyltransferase